MAINNSYINYDNINVILNFFKIFFLSLFSFYTSLKLSHQTNHSSPFLILFIMLDFIVSILTSYFINISPSVFSTPVIIVFVFILFLVFNNFHLFHSVIISAISLVLNYVAYFVAGIFIYLFSAVFSVRNLNIFFPILIIIYTTIILSILKQKRFKYGLTFINQYSNNSFLDIVLLNISAITLLFVALIPRVDYSFILNIAFSLIIYIFIISLTIYKSFSLYYKHNLLVKELNDTKLELEKKDKEIERLEKENLEFSKTSHSIAHKQRVLEYKLNQLQLNTEFANELDLSDKLKEISDTYSSNVTNLTLPKTGIENIDDILEYMQSECTKNNINFELQLNGDIFSMVTTVINKEKLEILLADHIKNAIIAINSSENINKSILVRLGLINDIYSICFYDSGIEFDENVLSSLGKEQITTHKDIGGTGCGFLNTFDTLKEFNASLEINEISAPCKDNYTKSIVIKFDGKNDFEINSYKKQ